MGVLTVRGVEEDLSAALKAEAAERKISVNALVLQMLREAVGMAERGPAKPRVYHDLDWFIGSITVEEADEMLRVIEEEFEQIDEEEWR